MAPTFGALMAQMVPWYYKLYWKMEGWLASKAYKSLDSDRGFFGRMLSDIGNYPLRETRLRLTPVPASSLAFSHLRHQQPMHETIRRGYL